MVDIIIPAYNAHSTIKKTLLSICMQTYLDKAKVYIVDDCSIDSYDEIKELFDSILDITILRLDKNRGPGYARQYGIDHSNSDYLMFIDSDDLLYDCFALERLYTAIYGCDMSAGAMLDEWAGGLDYIENHSGCLHGKLYSRSFLNKYNIRFNNTSSSEDNGFNRLVLLHAPELNVLNDVIYFYSNNANSITQKDKDYPFYSLEWFAYNMDWAIKNGKKDKCNPKLIAELVCSSMFYLYFQYLYNLKKDKANMILKWAKKITKHYKNYSKKIDEKTKYSIYSRYAPDYIVPISINEFINLVDLSDNWME